MVKKEFSTTIKDTLFLGLWLSLILAVFIYGWYSIYKRALDKQETLFQEQQALEVNLVSDIFEDTIGTIIDHYYMLLGNKIELYDNGQKIRAEINDGHPYVICRGLIGAESNFLFIQSKGKRSECKHLVEKWIPECRKKMLSNDEGCFSYIHSENGKSRIGVFFDPDDSEKEGRLAFALIDLQPLINKYVASSRDKRIGAGYILGGSGQVVYDHEHQIIGRNVFDLHAEYPQLIRLDKRMLNEAHGQGDYRFIADRRAHEEVRKLASWDSVDLGTEKLIIAVSAPEKHVFTALTDMRSRGIALSIGLALMMIIGLFIFFLYRQRILRDLSLRLEEQVHEKTNSLLRTKENLSITLNSIGDGVISTDAEGFIRFMNPVAQNIFAMNEEEVKGRRVEEIGTLKDPENPDRNVQHPVYRVLHSGESVSIEHPIQLVTARDERSLFISDSASPLKTEDGQVVGCVFVFRDVTEKYAREEELRQSEAMFRTFTESVDIAILIYRDQKWIYANPAAEEVTGYSQEELQQMKCWDSVHPDYREMVREKAMAREEGQDVRDRYHIKILTKQGQEKIIDFRAKSIFFHGQEAVMISVRDITEQLEKEKQRDRLERQLRQAQRLEAVGTLAGGIAHDFNNLLQGLSAHLEYLLKHCGNTTLSGHLGDMQGLVKRASDLVRRLLTFSRRTEVDKQELSMRVVIDNALHILKRTIPKMIRLNVDVDDENEIFVYADSGQLEQVLINLIKNAVDAIDQNKGGEITVACEKGVFSPKEILSKNLPGGEYVLVSVSDTGIGMDKCVTEQIFDPFFTTKEIGKGTGLGLATVYGIVNEHGGGISCYSEPGKGTTFRVYLPAIHRTRKSDGKPVKTGPRQLAGNEGVLLVDDEELILDMTSEMLKDVGYQVFTARSGEDALKVYKSNYDRVDIVVVDLGMPGMGGEQCLKKLLELNDQVKVIVASGYLEHKIKKAPHDFGAQAFVSKPYRLEKLLDVLRKVLEK